MQEPSNYFSEDEEQLAQRARVENSTWDGSPVVEHKGTTAELYRKLPIFSRHPYRSGGEENRYKDEIRREPLELTDSQIPITNYERLIPNYQLPGDNALHPADAYSCHSERSEESSEITPQI